MTYNEEQSEQIVNPEQHTHKGEMAPVMSFGEWFGTLLILLIPILNIIMLIVWITEPNTNPNKVNWVKATLVLIGIQFVVAMFFMGTIIGAATHMMSGLNQSGLW